MSVETKRKKSENLKETIEMLLQVSRENSSAFWRDIAKRLVGGRRRYASTNLSKIDSLTSNGDVIVVPGAVLGAGELTKKITISALRISSSALNKIKESGSEFKSIEDLSRENPKGTNIRIVR